MTVIVFCIMSCETFRKQYAKLIALRNLYTIFFTKFQKLNFVYSSHLRQRLKRTGINNRLEVIIL